MKRIKTGHFILAGLVALLVLAPPGKSRSLELGLTPSHVYSLWLDINRAVIVYAGIVSKDEARLDEIRAMQAAVFQDKNPADVFALAEKLSTRLRGSIAISSKTPDWLIEYEQVNPVAGPEGEEITPSAVFLISTHLLNGLVDVVVDNTGWEQPVSELYATELHIGKTPSDVFGLVDLALRRIKIILSADQG